MNNKVLSAIKRYDMLKEHDRVIIGLSGGADSCSLLYVMLELKDSFDLDIRACHINHNLRGSESDGDELFVRRLCEKLSVPLDVFSLDIKAASKKHESTEETARKLRYEHFSELCGRYGAKLATAHTASDNAETVLMNIIRGTGTKGLAGIPPVRDNIIRPLIFCSRGDIISYCAEKNIEYVTHSTNLKDDYTRNRIRHSIIPELEKFNPSFLNAVTRMTVSVRDDNAFLDGYAARERSSCERNGKLDSGALNSLPLPIKSRIIADVLKENGIEPSTLRIEQCLEIIEKGMGKVNICKNRFALVRKKLFFINTEEQLYRPK